MASSNRRKSEMCLSAAVKRCFGGARKHLWIMRHNPVFPLCRKSFNFTKPERDIDSMISTFNKAGIPSKRLTPGYIAWDIADEQQRLTDESTQTDLRLVGIGPGSFLDFASIYHSWYRKNKGVTELNRYAVIHCASASS